MIFVTVGTHEQAFDRLIEYIDNLKRDDLIKEQVVIQTGYSNYKPIYCMWEKIYPYQKMMELVAEARIVITHGGPSSFIMPLQIGKVPIVVPRMKKYGEHVNDHQVEFTLEVEKRMGTIIAVSKLTDLNKIIESYDTIISHMKSGANSNNANFNRELEKLVDKIMEK